MNMEQCTARYVNIRVDVAKSVQLSGTLDEYTMYRITSHYAEGYVIIPSLTPETKYFKPGVELYVMRSTEELRLYSAIFQEAAIIMAGERK